MTQRRIILGLILLTVAVFCLVAARKLTATPKYDRVQVGMELEQVNKIIPPPLWMMLRRGIRAGPWTVDYVNDEGTVEIRFAESEQGMVVAAKRITPRGPLERLAWLAGWRPRPAPATALLPVSPPPPIPPASK